jgi:endonuclease/exonuclease/phosphatase family metal-dependent hydrolase
LTRKIQLHRTLNIATFNIHKGMTHFNMRLALNEQRDILRRMSPDILFLQEVREKHRAHSQRFDTWPATGPMHFLSQPDWPHQAYGKNAEDNNGHHGNAILSKFPILQSKNTDISAHTIEQRGLLHCEIHIPNWSTPLHAFCIHLGLFAHWRRKQLASVTEYISQNIDAQNPLIIAGDFNDWSTKAGREFAKNLELHEVFIQHHGSHAKSFPAWFPMLKLDRIYVRGFDIQHATVHAGKHFLHVSDHAVLNATLVKK